MVTGPVRVTVGSGRSLSKDDSDSPAGKIFECLPPATATASRSAGSVSAWLDASRVSRTAFARAASHAGPCA